LKALILNRYGNTDVLKIDEVPRPMPEDNQVLIRVKAVSLNDWDLGLIRGRPLVNRSMAGNLFKPRENFIPGSDVAGLVEDTGRLVSRFRKGDAVFGDLSGSETWGGCAEYVCAREDELMSMGEGLAFEDAAALPQAGMLALQGLIEKGNFRPGQSLLINGAGGGVGTYGLQIARALGASYVAGVDRTEKLDGMKDLGFDKVLDYTKDEFIKEDRQYDLILDAKTSYPYYKYRNLLKKGGHYVTVGGKTGLLMRLMILRPLISLFYGRSYEVVFLKANRDLEYLRKLHDTGDLKTIRDGSFSFSTIIEAFERYSSGCHLGKVIVSF